MIYDDMIEFEYEYPQLPILPFWRCPSNLIASDYGNLEVIFLTVRKKCRSQTWKSFFFYVQLPVLFFKHGKQHGFDVPLR